MEQFYIGIDLCGTSVRIAACEKGKIGIPNIRKENFIRRERVIEEVEENICELINSECEKMSRQGKVLGGIGIALASLFDRKTGRIVNWPNNKKWNNFELMKFLNKRYHVPVCFEDDANAAALGEQLAGVGKGYTDLIYVTISTGVGCGIISNDTLLKGFHGWAGEIGHIKISGKDKLCHCGAKGCLQTVASGPALTRAYLENTKGNVNSRLELEDIALLALKGDKIAKSVFEEAGKYIGEVLANLIIILDVPVVILGGGVVRTGELIIKPIRKKIEESLQEKRKAVLIKTFLNDKNGVIGALALIDKEINGKYTIIGN